MTTATSNDFCICISSFGTETPDGFQAYNDGNIYRWADPGPKENPTHFVPLLSTTGERNEARAKTMEDAGVY
jgi:hypothetical protein